MSKRYEAVERELANWPDLNFFFEKVSKHTRLYLEYEGKKVFVVLSYTKSDHRADLNRIRDIRHAATGLGAIRKS